MYKHPTLVSILSISLSPSFLILLPQISLPPSLSASVHSISKKILDHLSDTPSKQLIVSPGLEVSPRHQHVNEGGSIALETPGAHRIGDWRLGY
uniref:Uncharacterized protein n=1 Tax=Salix viminalis TaxID=40686 RepID=A0A6N2KQ17_SALVM